jgi:lipoprotein-releasing system permease protein
MKLPLKIARRYLFAKKSTNAINIITGIAVFGICVGTAALILILSVFNGFETLITSMYSNFDPDVKVEPAQGKYFTVDSAQLEQLRALPGVLFVSQTLEEVAFFEYKENQDFGILKGVDEHWQQVTRIDSTVKEGRYLLRDGTRQFAVLGLGMRNKLAVNIDDPLSSLSVYMPKRQEVGLFEPQFRTRWAQPAGTFIIQHEFDNQYVLSTLELARELLALPGQASTLELKLAPTSESRQYEVIRQVKAIMGEDFTVKNRYEQEETFLRLMQVEKWLSFAIVSLMMLLVTFNMVGALWMVVLEKQKDIAILKSMGAMNSTVRNIFLAEGLLLCLLGIAGGFALGLLVFGIQKRYGIVGIPGNFVVNAYPIEIRFFDFVVVLLTVTGIGLLASLPPALRAQRVSTIIREE